MHKTPFVDTAYQPIEDYAIIGNLYTIALVGKNGSIDWCCLPHFDSPSVFGALLDANKGGFFRIAPTCTPDMKYKQLYIQETNVLITRFLAHAGVGEITDFMPVEQEKGAQNSSMLIRSVTVIRGSLSFEMTCRPAFNYAQDTHTCSISQNAATFCHENICLRLFSSAPLEYDDVAGVRSRFTLHPGQSIRFMLERLPEPRSMPSYLSDETYHELLQRTIRYWRAWLSHCRYQGRWREMVQRSALVLKLLTYAPTGAIVAAPTTSLPETPGGVRNWDYRYTWLRDSSFTLHNLLLLGFTQEAEAFMGWLDKRCHEIQESGSLQPVYSIEGKHDLTEVPLVHLEGYGKGGSVRIGNAAHAQRQLDVYGELMDAVYIFNQYTPISYDLWCHLRVLLDWLKKHWQEMDAGIWEVRGGLQHFVHSRLMSWVAFDRALRLAHLQGLPGPVGQWTRISAQIYEQIMTRGWSQRKQSFVQAYENEAIDASSLLMVLTGFTGPTDPRILGTIDRIQKELCNDSLVYRYRPSEAADDGIGSKEGTFNACSFWLAEALARAGRLEDARLLLEKMLSYANEVGLYAEEVGPTGEALGNYPQAFTHLALISACHAIDQALNKARLE